jgi:DNA-binding response OmpR family regulator
MTKVLLADDDLTMVSLLTTLLGMEGYQVGTLLGKTGDVLATIRKEKPDALLIDVYLGNLNGLDLVREIRATKDLKALKIIMASGVDKKDECLQAGANAFLLKPYMPEELFKYLRA